MGFTALPDKGGRPQQVDVPPTRHKTAQERLNERDKERKALISRKTPEIRSDSCGTVECAKAPQINRGPTPDPKDPLPTSLVSATVFHYGSSG